MVRYLGYFVSVQFMWKCLIYRCVVYKKENIFVNGVISKYKNMLLIKRRIRNLKSSKKYTRAFDYSFLNESLGKSS